MSPWYKILRVHKQKFQIEGFNISLLEKDCLTEARALEVFHKVFGDSNLYDLCIYGTVMSGPKNIFADNPKWALSSYKLGVTDNKAEVAREALLLFGVSAKVSSFNIFKNIASLDILHFGNPLIEKILLMNSEEIILWLNNNDQKYIEEKKINPQVSVFNLDLNDDELMLLQTQKCLALGLAELQAIKKHFKDPVTQNERQSLGLPKNPTDVEIEIIAQTWSEHCKHKIFNAEIDYSEEKNLTVKTFGPLKIKSLFKTYIKSTTEEIIKKRNIPWAISLFTDNAGVVQYEKDIYACLKVETHNSPSALDPYGGALTGILGVNRDILGVGLGAKPVANFDMFCLTPPSFPTKAEEGDLLQGVCHPQKIIKDVHLGVEDGGNKSGIPTINGSYFFDADYLAKPLVFVGTLGLMPETLSENRNSAEKSILPGDLIVMCGGKIGRDGIHGATFSSLELNTSGEVELSTVVQIGDPLTQKRLTDFVLMARDKNLFRAITDNGAGGLSSSVGEMAQMSGGARLQIENCPLKTHGLLPYEVVISESQERMTLATPKEKFLELSQIAKLCGVEITCVGEFTNSQKFEVFYHQEIMSSLPLEFLYHPPDLKLKATFTDKKVRSIYRRGISKEVLSFKSGFISKGLKSLMNDPNIASKEDWVRRYDHEVGAKTVSKPYASENNSPNGAGGIKSKNTNYILGHGLAPKWSLIDPYLMGLRSVDEAMRNIVAAGADPKMVSILDNFCTPDPVMSAKNKEGEWQLARLVRTNIGLKEAAMSYGTPLISGKDSMKNDFVGKNLRGEQVKHSVLPTLLVTALGAASDQTLNKGSFTQEGDQIFMIGPGVLTNSLVLSSLEENLQLPRYSSPHTQLYQFDLDRNFECFELIYKLHQHSCFSSLSDVNEDGALVNLFELLMGSRKGAKLKFNFAPLDLAKNLFGSSLATFVGTICREKSEIFKKVCSEFKIPTLFMGVVHKDYILEIDSLEIKEKIEMSSLEKIYRSTFTPEGLL